MERRNLEEIKADVTLAGQMLTKALRGISRLTEEHINSLPRTGLMGNADEASVKKSVPRHYRFIQGIDKALADVGEQRSALLTVSEKLDELSSEAEFDVVDELTCVGRMVFEMLKKIEEIEKMSGRFLGALDRASDVTGKGENADFQSAGRICREYFEFVANMGVYIDNLKIF